MSYTTARRVGGRGPFGGLIHHKSKKMPPVREFIIEHGGYLIHRSAATHRAARTRTLRILKPASDKQPARWMAWSRVYITPGHTGWNGPEGYSAAIAAAKKFIDDIKEPEQ